jgi:hypothetical protein
VFFCSRFLLKVDVALQELWDERDGLLGRGEHALQGEEEQHARQDTRQEEGLDQGLHSYTLQHCILNREENLEHEKMLQDSKKVKV